MRRENDLDLEKQVCEWSFETWQVHLSLDGEARLVSQVDSEASQEIFMTNDN